MTLNKDNVNKEGQIRRKLIRDAINCLLSRPATDKLDDDPQTIAQEIALNIVQAARKDKGSFRAFVEVRNTAEGMPTQAIVGEEGSPPVIDNSIADAVLKRYFSQLKE